MTQQDWSPDAALAIVGMAGRFPGARNVGEFWQNLVNGVKSIRFFSDQELLSAGVGSDVLRNPHYVKAGAILQDIALFDAPFFGLTPQEAEFMDPQTRLFMECAWGALEDAACDPGAYEGRIGVFAGKRFPRYMVTNLLSNPDLARLRGDVQMRVGNESDALASMVSYKLDLRGPAIAVQSFCSTSLVAIHLACQSLLMYECDTALAGGVAIEISSAPGYMYQESGTLSPDGECRAFDARANGAVMGDGLGIVVLKRLEDALQEGNHIYALILGSAMNNDGIARVGYMAPGAEGEANVILEALNSAGVSAETIGYVEAHGTGAPLGDAVELSAMIKAFRQHTDKIRFCAIGSCKPNVGHLDRAAGVAGLIKTALSLKHKLLPPSLNFERPNPQVGLEPSPFYVNTQLARWESSGSQPRRAGVSSFGLGGTNVHIVLQEAPEIASSLSRPCQLLLLSAKTEKALELITSNLATHLRKNPTLDPADVAYTLQAGRVGFNHRRMVVCRDTEDAFAALSQTDPNRVFTVHQTLRDRPVAFIFADVSKHYVGLAQELYLTEPIFTEWIDRCCEMLRPRLGLDLRDVLYPERDQPPTKEQLEVRLDLRHTLKRSGEVDEHTLLRRTELAPPAVFVIEYALAQLLMRWGVRPQALMGHGAGEYVAACMSGVLSLEDALKLATQQAQATLASEAGAMLTASLNPPQIPCLSSVTGDWITEKEAMDPHRWIRHPGGTAQFASGIGQLLPKGDWLLLEIGPGQSLGSLVRQQPGCGKEQMLSILPTLRHANDPQSDVSFLLNTLGKLWLAGATIDWSGFYQHEERRRVSLPTYPFERLRYWIEPGAGGTVDATITGGSEQCKPRQPTETTRPVLSAERVGDKKTDVADWFYKPVWQKTTALDSESARVQDSFPWIIFGDSLGLGKQIASYLARQGGAYVLVTAGKAFGRSGDCEFTIRPTQPDDYVALCRELVESGCALNKVVHLWNVTQDNELDTGSELFASAQSLGFYSLIYLAQAVDIQGDIESLEVIVVSNGVHAITGAEILRPDKSTLLGACKSIPQEYEMVTCRAIDIETPGGEIEITETLVRQLAAELVGPSSDQVVAYRGGERYVQTYEPVRLERPTKSPLRQRGTYLITGGFGGIGSVLAEHFAKTMQARLVLIGRTALPDRNEWKEWLMIHGESDRTSVRIRKVQKLEELGAEVLALQADSADSAQMRQAIEMARAWFGEIHGVVHAAGISNTAAFTMLQAIEPGQCEIHFRPKVHGLYVLEEVLGEQPLDFCVLFSSLSAVLAGLGMVAYTAANIFMDAFTDRHNCISAIHWTCVNWDKWQLSENEDRHGVLGGSIKEFAMTSAEGIEALERILARELGARIVVSTGDLDSRIQQWIELESLRGGGQGGQSRGRDG